MNSRTLHVVILLLGLAGLALFLALMLRHSVPDIIAAFAAARWGVAAVIGFHLLPLLSDVFGWRALIPPEHRFSFRRFFLIRWIGDSVSAILPVAHVGGEIVRVRLAAAGGIPLAVAGGSVLVGITISIVTQITFALSGLVVLMILTGKAGNAGPVIIGSIISVLVLALFYTVQHVGLFRLAGKVTAHFTESETWRGLLLRGEVIDHQVRVLYGRRKALLASAAWTLCTWMLGAAEVWVSLRALGVPATYAQCYVIESVVQSIRSVMFLVPGAIGVQEGGFLGTGLLLGIGSESLLALALIRRVREPAPVPPDPAPPEARQAVD